MKRRYRHRHRRPMPEWAIDRDALRKIMQMVWDKPVQNACVKSKWEWKREKADSGQFQIVMDTRNDRRYSSKYHHWRFRLED